MTARAMRWEARRWHAPVAAREARRSRRPEAAQQRRFARTGGCYRSSLVILSASEGSVWSGGAHGVLFGPPAPQFPRYARDDTSTSRIFFLARMYSGPTEPMGMCSA